MFAHTATTFFSVQSAFVLLSVLGVAEGVTNPFCGLLGCAPSTTTITSTQSTTLPASTVTLKASTVTLPASTITLAASTITIVKSTVNTVTLSASTVTLAAETSTLISYSTIFKDAQAVTSSSSSAGATLSTASGQSAPIASSEPASSTVESSTLLSSTATTSFVTQVTSSSSAASTTLTSSSSSSSVTSSAAATGSGIVQLPYATYQATHNETFGFYKYSNIRFADPPTGDLRFKNPVAPSTVETTIQDGSYGQTCYQLEQGTNSGAANQGEDCLFLDVIVPDNIPEGTKLPVLFYIYGGGWHTGQKEIYDGSDLVVTSGNAIIYVIPNYRLGAFGFLGQYGDVNPGTMDQLFALEWVQSYISLFGGDINRVTAAGHSAGAGCLETHLISNGGEGTVPFTQAVVMSPAVPVNYPSTIAARNDAMLTYFGLLGSTQAELQALDAQAVNDFTGHIGTAGWGPIMDGDYFREMPGNAFAAGRYHTGLNTITGQLADEGHDFTPTTSPYIIDGDSDIRDVSYDTKDLMISFFEGEGFNLTSSVIDQAWELYPLINDTGLYYTIFGKYDRILSEVLLDCNSYFISNAYAESYGWYFDVPPSYHAQENPYLFAGGTGSGGVAAGINATLSDYMKTYLVNFVKGDINADTSIPTWDAYSVGEQNLELGSTNVGMIADPSTNARCVFWQTNIQ